MVLSSKPTFAASINCCRFFTCPGLRANACTIQNSVRDRVTAAPFQVVCIFSPSIDREPRRMISAVLSGRRKASMRRNRARSEEPTSELQSPDHLVCRLLLEKKKQPHSLIIVTAHAHH